MEKKQISKKYQYDPLNRLVSVTQKDGLTQVYTYDPAGNRTMTTILEAMKVLPNKGVPELETQVPPISEAPNICSSCGKPITQGKKFCTNCGVPVSAPAPATPAAAASQPSQVCTACGNPIKPGAKFCGKCGKRFS